MNRDVQEGFSNLTVRLDNWVVKTGQLETKIRELLGKVNTLEETVRNATARLWKLEGHKCSCCGQELPPQVEQAQTNMETRSYAPSTKLR